MEITGPIAAKLWVSSSTEDADLFLVLRVFSPDFKEVVFQGALDPPTPVAQGGMRASHRTADRTKYLPHSPYPTQAEGQSLKPGRPYELDTENLALRLDSPEASHLVQTGDRKRCWTGR